MDAHQAIARSISHNEIVTLDYSDELESELRELADQSVNTGEVVEFWGGEAYGDDDWRVHLRRTRTAAQWWAWHDKDSARWSADHAEAETRCAAWVAGKSDDGPKS